MSRNVGRCSKLTVAVLCALSFQSSQNAAAEDVQMYNTGRSRSSRITVRRTGRPTTSGQAVRRVAPGTTTTTTTRPRTMTRPSTTTTEPSMSTTTQPTMRTRPARTAPRRSSGEIDLSTLGASTSSSSSPSSSTSASGSSSASFHGAPAGGGTIPNFKFYFDFLARHWKAPDGAGGSTAPLTFSRYHQRFMVEYLPYPELMFLADLSPDPKYYEVDYEITDKVQIRFGQIWIPFDDLGPHGIFGGRINNSLLVSGDNEQAFIPDFWAELGVGTKIKLVETMRLSSDLHLFITNGFQDGGSDPSPEGGVPAGDYPQFSGPGTANDNNNDKALGGRLHTKWGQAFGLGVSLYRSVYTDAGKPKQAITLMGGDVQIRPNNRLETRSGLMIGKVGLTSPPAVASSYSRGGFYIEQGVKFGDGLNWKFLGRAGTVQPDSRVIDSSDKAIIGATILRRVRSLEFSLHYDKDMKTVPTKVGYNYFAFRAVAAF